MDELRWILLILGAAIIAAVYYFGDPARRGERTKEKPSGGDKGVQRRVEPGLDGDLEEELERLGKVITEDRDGLGMAGGDAGAGTDVGSSGTVVAKPDRVVALYVKAPRGSYLGGSSIEAAAEKVGLEFGDLDIYHRLNETGTRREAIFSLANLTKPGGFDRFAFETLQTPGLCLFMTLPNPLPALDAWDAMLATGRRLADLLDADLQDESHSTLIRQRIAQLRDEMRDYDRRQEPGA